MTSRKQIVLVPYWLRDCPHRLSSSDHSWWLSHLSLYNKIIYAGPYIEDKVSVNGESIIISVKTESLVFDLYDIFNLKLAGMGISTSEITLYWHVIEVAATCRVLNTVILNCPKICVIGDTHHMKNPITGLIEYLKFAKFTHVCCSHNQYNPFFSALLKLKAIDFPFFLPAGWENGNTDISYHSSNNCLFYYGSTVSKHHIHRSKIVNHLLLDERLEGKLIIERRLSFSDWEKKVMRPHHNLSCSLNGTFSFQTFLPMLGGACIYTDTISNVNWVGSSLRSDYNALIYSSPSHLADLYLEHSNSLAYSESIGINAKRSISQFLKPKSILAYDWVINIPEERLLTTAKEKMFELALDNYCQRYGESEAIKIIKIFEDVQEVHRFCWSPKIYTESILSSNNNSCFIISSQNLLSQMAELLPRIKIYCKIKKEESTNKLTKSKLHISVINDNGRDLYWNEVYEG